MSVFETLAVSPSGGLLELDWHLDRLSRSAEWLRAPLQADHLKARLYRALDEWRDAQKSASRDHRLALRYTLSVSGRDDVSIRSYPREYMGGTVTVAPILSPPVHWLPRSVKHGSRAEWRVAALALEVGEVLLCDADGELLEADQSSVFAIDSGRLIYPPLRDGRRLESVGLRRALRVAERLGAPCVEAKLTLKASYDLLCLSSSLKGVALAEPTGAEGPHLSALGYRGGGLTKRGEVSEDSLALWRTLRSQVLKEMTRS
jgi:branched-subunit amino acid aminotransferase/4-amino-4-deoxychorismate lyase